MNGQLGPPTNFCRIYNIVWSDNCPHDARCNPTLLQSLRGGKRKGRLLLSLPLQTSGCSRLVAAHVVRRCCRAGAYWCRLCLSSHSGLTSRSRGRLGFARARGQHHREHRERRSNNDQFFHSMNRFSNNNSSEVAPEDVLKRRILPTSQSWPAVASARRVCVLLPEFSF